MFWMSIRLNIDERHMNFSCRVVPGQIPKFIFDEADHFSSMDKNSCHLLFRIFSNTNSMILEYKDKQQTYYRNDFEHNHQNYTISRISFFPSKYDGKWCDDIKIMFRRFTDGQECMTVYVRALDFDILEENTPNEIFEAGNWIIPIFLPTEVFVELQDMPKKITFGNIIEYIIMLIKDNDVAIQVIESYDSDYFSG